METMEFYTIEEIRKLVRELVKDEMEKIGADHLWIWMKLVNIWVLANRLSITYISQRKISNYKQGKKVYFKRIDLDDFVLNTKNRCKSHQEIESEVMTSLILKKSKWG